MGAEILRGAAIDALGVRARQLQRHERRFEQGIGLKLGGASEATGARLRSSPSPSAKRASALATPLSSSARNTSRSAPRGVVVGAPMRLISGRRVIDQVEPPFGNGVAADLDRGAERGVERDGELDEPFAAALFRRDFRRFAGTVAARDETDGLALGRVRAHDQFAALRHGKRAERLGARSTFSLPSASTIGAMPV